MADSNSDEIIINTREKEGKRRRDALRMKLIRKYEQAKAFDSMSQPDLSQHLISNLPNLNDTFNGFSGFFTKMFGR